MIGSIYQWNLKASWRISMAKMLNNKSEKFRIFILHELSSEYSKRQDQLLKIRDTIHLVFLK